MSSFNLTREPRGICQCSHDADHHLHTTASTVCARLDCGCKNFTPGGTSRGDASVWEIQQKLSGNGQTHTMCRVPILRPPVTLGSPVWVMEQLPRSR